MLVTLLALATLCLCRKGEGERRVLRAHGRMGRQSSMPSAGEGASTSGYSQGVGLQPPGFTRGCWSGI